MYLSQILIYLLVGVTILVTLFEPYIGIIVYYIFELIRPQDLFFWGLEGSRLSFWIAGATFVSWIFHRAQKRKTFLSWPIQNTLMIAFLATAFVSHLFSTYRDASWISLVRISKMILIYFIATSLIDSQKHIRYLAWCIVLSIGYLAFRGNWQYFILGWHQITKSSFGGGYIPLDNNGYAVLFTMALPFVYFLFLSEKQNLVKVILGLEMLLLIHAVILTYSRGGFIGMCVVLLLCLFRTNKKTIIVVFSILFIGVIVRLSGSDVVERLRTITRYEEDSSAMSRIEAWRAGVRMMAEHPFTGVGLDNYRYFVKVYNPEKFQNTELVAHNAFIHTAGEAGMPALVLYIFLLLVSFRDLYVIARMFRNSREKWQYYYSSMFTVSLWGYVACGIFLTLAWFELFYPMIALTVGLKKMTQKI